MEWIKSQDRFNGAAQQLLQHYTKQIIYLSDPHWL